MEHLDEFVFHENHFGKCCYILIRSHRVIILKMFQKTWLALSPWPLLNEVLMKWFVFSVDKRSPECVHSIFSLTQISMCPWSNGRLGIPISVSMRSWGCLKFNKRATHSEYLFLIDTSIISADSLRVPAPTSTKACCDPNS